MSAAGYRCAAYGKWHVGEGTGRWPTDKGFDEWYGPPRTYDEALWPTDPWYDPQRDPTVHMLGATKGDAGVIVGDQLTLDVRRDCDVEYLRRATAFMRDAAQRDAEFFVYFNHSLMHMPVIPRAEFKGCTGNGDWADSLAQLDADFGTLLDVLTELGIVDDTLVVFAGDNGPEELQPWRGSPGYWEGSYFAGGEGNLRTPCIARWPGHIPAGQVSNDIMHVTDWFATLLRAAGIEAPADRVIDGIDQMSWLAGDEAESNREGYIYWLGARMYGVKWRNFKLVLVSQKYSLDAPAELASPHIVNLVADPHEREPMNLPYLHTWTMTHFNRILTSFKKSLTAEPLTPVGAPLEYVPGGRVPNADTEHNWRQ